MLIRLNINLSYLILSSFCFLSSRTAQYESYLNPSHTSIHLIFPASHPTRPVHFIFPSTNLLLPFIFSSFAYSSHFLLSTFSMGVVKYFCYGGSFIARLFRIRTQELRGIRKIQHSQSGKCVVIFLSRYFPALSPRRSLFFSRSGVYYTPILVPLLSCPFLTFPVQVRPVPIFLWAGFGRGMPHSLCAPPPVILMIRRVRVLRDRSLRSPGCEVQARAKL
jgi:hypothetical protein